MSKLLKLKEWLTVEETAKRLSITAGEEVTEADVLRLALDGHMTLSVYFVNHARARPGKFVLFSETEWTFMPPLPSIPAGDPLTAEIVAQYPRHFQQLWHNTPPEQRNNCIPMLKSLATEDNRYINLHEDVLTLTGVWDLPLIGCERIDVEYAYQQLIGGPEVTLEGLEGSFVSQGEDTVCQLQESWEQNPYQKGSLAALERIKETIFEKGISPEKADQLLIKHKEDRVLFLENQAHRPDADRYYPAGGIPRDSVLVVRTVALRKLEEKLLADETQLEKPLQPSERKSTEQIIATLAAMANLDLTKPYKADETLRTAAATHQLELPNSPETTVKYLKAAASRSSIT
jgi:hypothetical protein